MVLPGKSTLKFLIRDNVVFCDRDFDPLTGFSFCFSEQEAVETASVLVVGVPGRHLLALDSLLLPSRAEVPASAGHPQEGPEGRTQGLGPVTRGIPADPSPRLIGTLAAKKDNS